MSKLTEKYKTLKKEHPEMIMWTKTFVLTILLCGAVYAGANSFGFKPSTGSNERSYTVTGTSSDWTKGSNSGRQEDKGTSQNSVSSTPVSQDQANAMVNRLEAQRARTRQAIEDSQPDAVKRARERAGDDPDAFNAAFDEEINRGTRNLNERARSINSSNPEEAMRQTRDMVEEMKNSGQLPKDLVIPGM